MSSAPLTAAVMNDLGLTEPLLARMVQVRRHLHAHPELSNQEQATQVYLRDVLTTEGVVDVRTVAGTGLAVDVVGTAGPSNRKLAIRADIDALPITEESGLEFASQVAGVMHACGHDAHAAMVFATAIALYRTRDRFSGTVRLIFQPAEEAEPLGGRRVVEAGLLDDVEAAIGIHVDPYLPTGHVAVSSGAYTLACDIFDIVIAGRSAHAAKPAEGIDTIAVASAVVGELQKIVARETDAFDPLILSVTGIHGGGAYNIIADRTTLRGTIRSGNEQTRERAHHRLHAVVQGVAQAHGATAEVSVVRGEPPVVNDPGMATLISTTASRLLGTEYVIGAPGWTAADDFGFYSQRCPSVYFRLGVRNEELGAIHPLHHPQFRIDENAMQIGAAELVAAAIGFLRPDPP